MDYRCSIYGLGLVANRRIPGVPLAATSAGDVRIHFGFLPAWLNETLSSEIEPCYVTEYKDDAGKPGLMVFKIAGGKYYKFCYADETEFLLDQTAGEIWAVWPETLTLEDTATYLLGPIMGFVLLLRGVICLHASAIVVGKEAIALVGPAGSGKSTTAAAFSTLGFSVLAEDVVTLDDHGDTFLVRPAYPCIRLWPASVKALYGDETQLPKLTPNWDKRYLDLTQRPDQFQTEPLPLAAIYQLTERRDGPEAPFVQPVQSLDRMISLVANTYGTNLMDKQMRAHEFKLLSRVQTYVPLRQVTPHTNPARIQELCESILEDFDSIKSCPGTQVIHV